MHMMSSVELCCEGELMLLPARVWQWLLAPPEKRVVVLWLPHSLLHSSKACFPPDSEAFRKRR